MTQHQRQWRLSQRQAKVLPSVLACLLITGAMPLEAEGVPITFEFEGVIGLSCFFCTSQSTDFGTGVVPGTPLTGRYTFDSETTASPTFQVTRVDYIGVSVEFSVGSELVKGNDALNDRIQLHDGPPSGDSYSLLASSFSTGMIAGETIDQFVWVVSATSTLFSDTSLPLTPDFFGPGLGTRVCIGDCFQGEVLEGEITALRLVAIPEPSTVILLSCGLTGLVGWRWWKSDRLL